MVLLKILKRRDASSVVVAILVAMIVMQPLTSMTAQLASVISNIHNGGFGYGPGGGWKTEYLFPIVWAVLELIVLEILGWMYVLANRPLKRKK